MQATRDLDRGRTAEGAVAEQAERDFRELVRERILYAAEVLGDPQCIQVNPDCGLRTRSWDVVYEKLSNMV